MQAGNTAEKSRREKMPATPTFFFLSYQTQYPGKQEVTTGLTFCDKQDQLYNSSLSTNS